MRLSYIARRVTLVDNRVGKQNQYCSIFSTSLAAMEAEEQAKAVTAMGVAVPVAMVMAQCIAHK